MKVLVSFGFALLFVASLSEAEPSAMEEKDAELKEEIIKKIADLGSDSDPQEVRSHLQELENIMDQELPKDPELRQNILKNMYYKIVEGQGQGQVAEGRRGVPDPFDPFQEVPFPR